MKSKKEIYFLSTTKYWILSKATFCWVLLFLIFSSTIFAQSRNELETKRKSLLNEIRVTTSLLKKTSRNRAAELDRFIALKNQIAKREELIETLRKEIELVTESTDRTDDFIQSLNRDLQLLEEEYGMMARSAYRQRLTKSNLLFLLSAESINQAYRRWLYLKQYDRNRRRVAGLIVSTQQTLDEKLAQLEQDKLEKEELLADEEMQQIILGHELDDKNRLLVSLQKDEKRLRKELNVQQRHHQKLNYAIESVIKRSMAKRRKKERSKQTLTEVRSHRNASRKSPAAVPKASTTAPTTTINHYSLTSGFVNNKGALPWPVSNGVITKYFGKQPHPTLKKIKITNNGIDILTDRNARVKAIYDGEVVGVQFIPGYSNMLILRHGDYYTVYSNLEQVNFKKGETVRKNQVLGQVSMDQKSRKSEVHFEVWKNKTRLNPVHWIQKRR